MKTNEEKLEIRIPHNYNEEIKISKEIAEIVLCDDSIIVDDYEWYVVNNNVQTLGLADVVEEHNYYTLLGYLQHI